MGNFDLRLGSQTSLPGAVSAAILARGPHLPETVTAIDVTPRSGRERNLSRVSALGTGNVVFRPVTLLVLISHLKMFQPYQICVISA